MTQTAPRICLVSHIALNLWLFRRPLTRMLAEEGWNVTFIAPEGPHMDHLHQAAAEICTAMEGIRDNAAECVTIRTWPLERGSLAPSAALRGTRALESILIEEKPDVIHTFTHQPNILGRLAMRKVSRALRRRPVLINAVTGLGSCFLGSGLKGVAVRMLFYQLYARTASKARAVLFQNEDDRLYFEYRRLTGSARTAVIRGSGVDTERLRPGLLGPAARKKFRASLGLKPDHVVCTMAARLIHDKGVREILLAARSLGAALPELRFLIVGEPDPGNPRSLTDEDMKTFSGLGNVLFPGWREDMADVWAASDMAVLPSYREGLPVSLQEAMACGLPVVTTDVPGCRELARSPQGELLPPETCGAMLVPAGAWPPLAEAIGHLVSQPELRTSLGQAARNKAVQEFDARAIARQTIDLYAKLMR
ncbi:glycosyltransferase family 4 protein [Oceanidesulfovibrio marinus]|uniref:Glycosyltransferase family 4 protein n=1 Tax=Oceanidesulfovibrio marinus TaxID=370038 RepID=A0ABX6NIA4_9BACT|nr:glycosyltransferase family 4 protein [Oceanidesulfovibrio marinus]QJT10383.1 glycosyltransferase family 4 protein [Oceanidesulfovibrio marinus]